MVTVEQILNFWSATSGEDDPKDYCLDVSHPLGFFSSVDEGRQAFLIISPVDPRELISLTVDAIELEIGRREWDGQWVCYFILLNPRLDIAFAELASSLVNNSRDAADATDAMRIVGQSIHELQLLFAIDSKLKPSLQEIRGLFAELWFLRFFLTPKIGLQNAVEAWKGPVGATHDFDLSDSNFCEVKSRRLNTAQVRISSPEQLSLKRGDVTLVVVAFDDSKLLAQRDGSLSIFQLFSNIIAMDECSATSVALLRSRMISAGFNIDDELYRETLFTHPEVQTYSVAEDFPRLRLEDIPVDVSRVSYHLSTERLSSYEFDWFGE